MTDALYDDLVNEVLLSEVGPKGLREFEQKYLPMADRKDLFVQFARENRGLDDKRLVGIAAGHPSAPTKPGNFITKPGEAVLHHLPGSNQPAGTPFSKGELRRLKPDYTLFNEPGHSDPTAVYTYPLGYVIHHPTSIPHLAEAPFIRVLKLKPGAKVLDVQTLTKDQAIGLLRKMRVLNSKNAEQVWQNGVKAGMQKFSPHQPTVPKVFFLIAQTQSFKSDGWGGHEVTTADNNLQRKRLLQAGIQVVIDTAKGPQDAVIHSNEPEQAFFLTPAAFDVVDAYKITDTGSRNIAGYRQDTEDQAGKDPRRMLFRTANQIIQAIDPGDAPLREDVVRGGIEAITHPLPSDGTINVRRGLVIFTKRGRAVSVIPGEKPTKAEKDKAGEGVPAHRRGGRDLEHGFEVKILSERGTTAGTISREETLFDGARRLAGEFKGQKVNPDWRPVRGVTAAGEVWREVLSTVSPTTGRAYQDTDVLSISTTATAALRVNHQLELLLGTVGWRWEAPTDKWERMGAWKAAADLYRFIMQRRSIAWVKSEPIIKAAAERFRHGQNKSPISEAQMAKLKGTPVEKPALAILAGTCDEKFMTGQRWLEGLINGLEMVMLKRWVVFYDTAGGFGPTGHPLEWALENLIKDCEEERYEEILRNKFEGEQATPSSVPLTKRFHDATGAWPQSSWGKARVGAGVNEVIIGNQFSLETPNTQGGGAMPTVWRSGQKEARFTYPQTKQGGKDARIQAAKAAVEKIVKRTLVWNRDPSTGSETAYVGDGRKVRVARGNNITAAPRTVLINADRMPANLAIMLGA